MTKENYETKVYIIRQTNLMDKRKLIKKHP